MLYITFSLLNDQSKTVFNIYSTVRVIARQITVIDISLMGDSNTLKCKCKEILKIYLIEQKIYPNHQDECYVSDSTVLGEKTGARQ